MRSASPKKAELHIRYTVRFRKAVYVLHCFQKKSPSGIRTAQTDVELVRRRLKAAREDYEVRYGEKA
jgi:phage-related protein